MVKKSVISLALIGVVALAVASSGGGGSKKSTKAVHGLDLVKSGNNLHLSLRSSYGANAAGKALSAAETIKAYRKGSIFYIMPAPYAAGKVSMSSSTNNLTALHLKLRIGK